MTDWGQLRIFAVVSTLQPSPIVAARVASVADQVEGTVVVIDACSPEKLKALASLRNTNIQLLPLEDNVGVAKVLNSGAAVVGASDNDLLLFLDDDTDLHRGYIRELIAELRRLNIDMSQHIVGPSVVHLGDHCKVLRSAHSQACQEPIKKKLGVISSGMLVQKQAFDTLGGYCEALFIDSVDYEFCLRAAESGVTTLQLGGHHIIHQLGGTTQHEVFGMTLKTTNHSPLRRRYYIRNSCKVAWQYKSCQPRYAVAVLLHHLKTAALIACFERNRFAKLGSLLAGYWDFLVGRVGRIDV